MSNPWSRLQPDELALPKDKEIIDRYNPSLKEDFRIHTEVLPVPFLGTPKTAEIYLLHLNPRYVAANLVQHECGDYRDQNRKSLTFNGRYPFLYLDPELEWTAGFGYWHPRLTEYISDLGGGKAGRLVVAAKFMCVQYFPYRSNRFKPLHERLPSQEYGFQLVREAMGKNKFIVVMRSWAIWKKEIPELESYPYLVKLRNPRNPYLSRKQLGACYGEVLQSIA